MADDEHCSGCFRHNRLAFPQEQTLPILSLFQQLPSKLFQVPRLWHIEVANVLLMNRRRGKYGHAELHDYFKNLSKLEIGIDEETEFACWIATLHLAMRHGLTIYDASYLELAVRLRAPLDTLDSDLRRAASVEGVALLGM